VFSWSYRQVTSGTARVFRLLGLHPGPDISVPAAASLAGTPLRLGRQHLTELTAANLVTEPQPGRYALHDLLRAYAAEQAEHTEPQADRDTAARRAVNYYLHQTYQAALQIWPNLTLFLKTPVAALESVTAAQITSRSSAVDWYRAEQQVLPRVLAWGAHLRLDLDVVQLRTCMEPYDRISDLPATNEAMLAAALRLGDPTFSGAAYYGYGREAVRRGSYQEAVGHYANALQHATLSGNLHFQALVHLGLASAADHMGHLSDAVQQGRRAFELAQMAGAREAEYLSFLGYFEARAGNTKQGQADCERAVALLRGAGSEVELARGLTYLGMSCQLAGRSAEAITHLREAIALARESDMLSEEANSLMWLGDAFTATGDARAAREAWQQALGLYRELAPSHPNADKIRTKLKQAER
jgi:tetratricopeptide (TPR) repeat protein